MVVVTSAIRLERKELEISHATRRVVVPYFEFGAGGGPVVFVSGGMHGDEINGITTVRALLDWLMDDERFRAIRGRLLVLPVLNPSGFSHMQRRVVEDGEDLNRSFGTTGDRTFSHVVAEQLATRLLRHCNFGIDIHDAGVTGALTPHCRVYADEHDGCADCSTHIGRLLGTRIIVRRSGSPAMLANHLRFAHGVPVVTVELGGGQLIYPQFQQPILEGILNILKHLGIIEGQVQQPGRQFFLKNRYGVSVEKPCAVRFDVRLGDEVHAGDVLGELYYPLEHRTAPIVSAMCGYVFSLWPRNQAPAGQRIYSILEQDHCHVTRTTLDMFQELEPLVVKKIRM